MKNHKALGERRIIEIIRRNLDVMPRMPIPFGDDVSAYDLGKGKLAILKTDMLVGKTDVPPSMSLWQAARKAVVMNVSDFAAKGAKPFVLLVSLGLPPDLSKKNVEEIGKGLNAGAREYGVYVVGGDTGEASDLVISVSLFGTVKKNDVVLRSGAKPEDIVAVTGCFGKTSAGLKILLKGFAVAEGLRRPLVESVLMPRARLKEGLALCQTGAVSSAIDSSDGLAWCLHEIANASNVGFHIDRVPVAEEAKRFADENGLDPVELALHGGEEYELVVTVKPELWNKAEASVKNAGGRLICIGKVVAGKRVQLETEGEKRAIERRGYEHFVNSRI